jgi:CubicO group peptidase (beta-lactamase class C family)
MPGLRLIAAVLVFVLSALPALAQTPTPQAEPPILPIGTPSVPLIASPDVDLSTVTPLPLDGERREQFRAFIASALEACDTPGAAVAVVQNGEVVFLEGFGVREYGRLDPVTPDTLFRIGSITKSFTATLAAALVDAGLIAWETPVVDLLPGFALSDPELTERVTVADVLSGATGLPRRDLEIGLEADALTPAGLLASVQTLPLLAPLGERFQYSNQAFGIAGFALAAAAGAAPNDLRDGYALTAQRHVLDPIGMERSTFVLDNVLARGDYAVPHAPDLAGTPQAIPLLVEERFVQAVSPAGALWSTAREMARYLQTQLARGIAPDGDRVISEQNLLRTHQPGVAVSEDASLPAFIDAGLDSYGLGWFVGDYGGLELISHGGGTYGFAAEAAFLPEADLGVAVLTNEVSCGELLVFAIQYRLFELVFDQEPAIPTLFDTALAERAAVRQATVAQLQSVDLDVVTPLLGWYEHPALGPIELTSRDGQLVVDAGELRSRLQVLPGGPDGPDRYVAVDPPLSGGQAWITFEEDENGQLRPVLTVLGTFGEDPLVYPFTPLAGESASPSPTPVP